MQFKELSLKSQFRAIRDYINDSIIEDQDPDEVLSILSNAPQYDYNEDGTLYQVN